MIDRHYDIEKKHIFSDTLMIELPEDIFLYCLNDLLSIDLKSTPLEFLARFRRVDLNGNLFSNNSLGKVKIEKGFKVIIRNNGDVGILDLNSNYFIFDNKPYESLVKCELPKDTFGLYNSYIHILFENFVEYLNSFRTYSIRESNIPVEFNLIMKQLEEESYNG